MKKNFAISLGVVITLACSTTVLAGWGTVWPNDDISVSWQTFNSGLNYEEIDESYCDQETFVFSQESGETDEYQMDISNIPDGKSLTGLYVDACLRGIDMNTGDPDNTNTGVVIEPLYYSNNNGITYSLGEKYYPVAVADHEFVSSTKGYFNIGSFNLIKQEDDRLFIKVTARMNSGYEVNLSHIGSLINYIQ